MAQQDTQPPNTRPVRSNGRKRSHSDFIDQPGGSSLLLESNDTGNATTLNSINGNLSDNCHLPSPEQTPRRPKHKKQVRFTDPGSLIARRAAFSEATGLSPAMSRFSVNSVSAQDQDEEVAPQSPSRPRRRRSAPIARLPDLLVDPVIPSPIVMQFTPYRQMLDARTRRRLARRRLSEESNALESERRQERKQDKDMQKAQEQIEALRKELESYKSAETQLQAQARPEIQEEMRDTSHDTMPVDDDITMDDSGFVSDSPAFTNRHGAVQTLVRAQGSRTSSPHTPRKSTADSAVQANVPDEQSAEKIKALTDELATSQHEKEELFDEWRLLMLAQTHSESQEGLSPYSPDFIKEIIPTMRLAMREATDGKEALCMVRRELQNMGFSGFTAQELLSQLRESVRTARLELENMLPGETPGNLNDARIIFETLVKRLKQSFNALINERKRSNSLEDSQRALTQQFKDTLARLEGERLLIQKYRESSDASAEDMLHVRMRLQEMEAELADKATLIERYSHALKQYHEEGKFMEEIIEKLENGKKADDILSAARISELENEVIRKSSIVSEQEQENLTLAESVKEKESLVNELTARVHALQAQSEQLGNTLKNQEAEIEKLATQYTQESENLKITTMNLERAELVNSIQRRRDAVHHRNFQKWLDGGKEFLGPEGRGFVNNEMLANYLNSEPDLPENSPSKAARDSLENIRVGRGKDYRTLNTVSTYGNVPARDSGIGLSTDNLPSSYIPDSDDAIEYMFQQQQGHQQEHQHEHEHQQDHGCVDVCE